MHMKNTEAIKLIMDKILKKFFANGVLMVLNILMFQGKAVEIFEMGLV